MLYQNVTSITLTLSSPLLHTPYIYYTCLPGTWYEQLRMTGLLYSTNVLGDKILPGVIFYMELWVISWGPS